MPGTGPVNTTSGVVWPTQYVLLLTVSIGNDGFTVMVNVIDGPVQATPLLVNVGVTVNVLVKGIVSVFVAVNDGMESTPERESRPMAPEVRVHW